MARRAASIWRAVTRSGSIAFSPCEPKFSAVPPLAAPWMRPLWALRNFVRFGCNMVQSSNLGSGLLGCRALAAAITTTVATIATITALAVVTTRTPAAAFLQLVEALLGAERVVLHDLALEDPHLDADDTVGRACNAVTEVDVGAQGMQRHAALAVPLGAGDFGAAQTAGDVDPDADRAETQRR